MGFIGKLPEHIDKILIFHYLGAAQLAVYAFALTPISHLKLLNDIPVRLMLPNLATHEMPTLQSTLPKKVFLISLSMLAIVLIYIVLAPFLFQLLFPKYMGAVVYSQVIAFSLVLIPGSLFAEALVSQMKKRELYITQVSVPAVRIVLYLALLPFFGIWGAIAAIFLSQFYTVGLNAWLFWRAT